MLSRIIVFLGIVLGFSAIGFIIPMLFDRDVGGALASAVFGVTGAIVGASFAILTIRRIFD